MHRDEDHEEEFRQTKQKLAATLVQANMCLGDSVFIAITHHGTPAPRLDTSRYGFNTPALAKAFTKSLAEQGGLKQVKIAGTKLSMDNQQLSEATGCVAWLLPFLTESGISPVLTTATFPHQVSRA